MIVTLLLNITDAIPVSINNVILIKKRSFGSVRILHGGSGVEPWPRYVFQLLTHSISRLLMTGLDGAKGLSTSI